MRRKLAPAAWDENVPKLALMIGFGDDIPPPLFSIKIAGTPSSWLHQIYFVCSCFVGSTCLYVIVPDVGFPSGTGSGNAR